MKINISESEYRYRCERMEEFVYMRFPSQKNLNANAKARGINAVRK